MWALLALSPTPVFSVSSKTDIMVDYAKNNASDVTTDACLQSVLQNVATSGSVITFAEMCDFTSDYNKRADLATALLAEYNSYTGPDDPTSGDACSGYTGSAVADAYTALAAYAFNQADVICSRRDLKISDTSQEVLDVLATSDLFMEYVLRFSEPVQDETCIKDAASALFAVRVNTLPQVTFASMCTFPRALFSPAMDLRERILFAIDNTQYTEPTSCSGEELEIPEFVLQIAETLINLMKSSIHICPTNIFQLSFIQLYAPWYAALGDDEIMKQLLVQAGNGDDACLKDFADQVRQVSSSGPSSSGLLGPGLCNKKLFPTYLSVEARLKVDFPASAITESLPTSCAASTPYDAFMTAAAKMMVDSSHEQCANSMELQFDMRRNIWAVVGEDSLKSFVVHNAVQDPICVSAVLDGMKTFNSQLTFTSLCVPVWPELDLVNEFSLASLPSSTCADSSSMMVAMNDVTRLLDFLLNQTQACMTRPIEKPANLNADLLSLFLDADDIGNYRANLVARTYSAPLRTCYEAILNDIANSGEVYTTIPIKDLCDVFGEYRTLVESDDSMRIANAVATALSNGELDVATFGQGQCDGFMNPLDNLVHVLAGLVADQPLGQRSTICFDYVAPNSDYTWEERRAVFGQLVEEPDAMRNLAMRQDSLAEQRCVHDWVEAIDIASNLSVETLLLSCKEGNDFFVEMKNSLEDVTAPSCQWSMSDEDFMADALKELAEDLKSSHAICGSLTAITDIDVMDEVVSVFSEGSNNLAHLAKDFYRIKERECFEEFADKVSEISSTLKFEDMCSVLSAYNQDASHDEDLIAAAVDQYSSRVNKQSITSCVDATFFNPAFNPRTEYNTLVAKFVDSKVADLCTNFVEADSHEYEWMEKQAFYDQLTGAEGRANFVFSAASAEEERRCLAAWVDALDAANIASAQQPKISLYCAETQTVALIEQSLTETMGGLTGSNLPVCSFSNEDFVTKVAEFIDDRKTDKTICTSSSSAFGASTMVALLAIAVSLF